MNLLRLMQGVAQSGSPRPVAICSWVAPRLADLLRRPLYRDFFHNCQKHPAQSNPPGPPPSPLEAPGPSFRIPPPLPWTPLPPPRTSPQPIPTTLQLMLPCSCQVALVFVFSGASYEGTSLHGQARDFLRRLAESICRLFLGSPEQESRGSLPNRSRGAPYMLLDQLRCMCKAGASADT